MERLSLFPPFEDEKRARLVLHGFPKLFLDGDVKVNHLLSAPLPSRGMVVHGNARGRTVGYQQPI